MLVHVSLTHWNLCFFLQRLKLGGSIAGELGVELWEHLVGLVPHVGKALRSLQVLLATDLERDIPHSKVGSCVSRALGALQSSFHLLDLPSLVTCV